MTLPSVTAVVLAGGFGTRIKHLLGELPKPMAVVAGEPFMAWVGRYLRRQGVGQAILSTGYKGEMIADYFASSPIEGLKISCRLEDEPKGTAGGFLHAISEVEPAPGAWLVCNGDSLVLADLAPFFERLFREDLDACILSVRMTDASRYGTVEPDAKGLLQAFHEKRAGGGLINAGVYLFRPETVARFPEAKFLGFEGDVFPSLVASGARIGVHVVDAPFIDIGIPETLGLAADFIQSHRAAFGAAA